MPEAPTRAGSLSVVIVTYNSGEGIQERLEALSRQLEPGDEIIVVDNASRDRTAELVASAGVTVSLIRNGKNIGFAAGSNLGAAQARGDLLLFLNPDVTPEPGSVATLRASKDWDVWQGLLLLPDGKTVNTAGGELHYLGIAWAGGCGASLDTLDEGTREVAFASGACLMLKRDTWCELRGFDEAFFMYCEDVDLSLRARLRGRTVGVEPRARFRHEYSFDKGSDKWRLLERNRWFTLVRTYPFGLLLAVMPALLATELAITASAAMGGWLSSKLRSYRDVVRALPRLLRERGEILRGGASAGSLASVMTPVLDSPHLPQLARSRPVALLSRGYWWLVTLVIER